MWGLPRCVGFSGRNSAGSEAIGLGLNDGGFDEDWAAAARIGAVSTLGKARRAGLRSLTCRRGDRDWRAALQGLAGRVLSEAAPKLGLIRQTERQHAENRD